MNRRFNFTGRRRIPRSRVRITVAEEGGRRRFDASLHLDGMDLPGDADVFVEAYHRSAYQRFGFGAVARMRPPAERWLDRIPVRHPLFRVKVVRRDGPVARIVAAADKVVAEEAEREEEARQSLLPVEHVDLGDEVWALDLESDWPRLLLNKRIEGIREAARSGAEFLALVYPQVFRAILERVLKEKHTEPELEDEDWPALWLRFACVELGRPRPPETSGEAAPWIEDAVQAFCARLEARSAFERLLVARS